MPSGMFGGHPGKPQTPSLLNALRPYQPNLQSLFFNTVPPANALSAPPARTAGHAVHDKAVNALLPMVGKRMANKLADLIDYSPAAIATDAFQLGRDLRQKDYVGAAINALSAASNFVPDAKVAAPVLHSIIAPLFHGSPHKFEKFALEKIGTGEGAQAYGHGLYFAENPETARAYQANVKNMGAVRDVNTRLTDLARQMSALEIPGRYGHYKTPEGYQMKEEYDALLGKRSQTLADPGHLYEVKLDANPEDFLNWDKSITDQPAPIRNALGDAGFDVNDKMPTIQTTASGKTFWIQHPGGWEPMGAPRFRSQAKAQEWMDANGADMATRRTGENLWRQAQGQAPNAANAAANLKALGLPGIRYFDAGSRVSGHLTGEGTSNYVVFDPSIIDILNRQ